LLDTNIASDAIKGDPAGVRERLVGLPMRSVMSQASSLTPGFTKHLTQRARNSAVS
jgi:hypothetical protein